MTIHPPGTRIGPYEIASRPLMGGMGIVYICLDRETDRPVALKTFKPEYLPDRAARDRFLREGTHWVDLGAHPHIVHCYRVLRTDPEVYLVLELVAKEQGREDASLRSWLTPGQPLPVEQSLLFALQIARGMAHAASTIPGFVHRDLKPENILVGADRLPGTAPSQMGANRLRVTDFGLAAILQETVQQTGELPVSDAQSPIRHSPFAIRQTQLTHGIVGTPLYMAPEQWKGEPVGIYTDVYALGCILYEMLAGQRAVSGHTLSDLQRTHCSGDLRPFPPDLPEPLSTLLTRCLATEPAERYTNWDTVAAALVTAYEELAGRYAPEATLTIDLNREERVAAGWSYNAMGNSYLDISKVRVAVEYFERAWSIGKAEGEQQLESGALNNLGETYRNLGDARRAIGYYEQALEIIRETGDRHGEWSALGNIGIAYKNLGDARRAIGYFELQLIITQELKDQRGEGNALMGLGGAYFQLGDIHPAIGFFEQALVIARRVGDRRIESAAQGNLGIAYLELDNAPQAIGHFEQCLAIHREIGDRRGEENDLGNLGIAYANLGDAQRAIGYYKQALEIAREIGDRLGEGAALGNLGSAYLQLGDARRAVGYYEQHLEIAREIGDINGVAIDSLNLAQLYVEQGQFARALKLAREAASIWGQIGHAQYAQRARQLVMQLRAAMR